MLVEIDQSGKLEQLDTLTAVAYSNGKSGAVILNVALKRKLIRYFRKKIPEKAKILPVFFSLIIYILINRLGPNITIVIDEEYTGKNKVIKQFLTILLLKKFFNKWQGSIRFGRIGKHSPAHQLAWTTHRNKNRKRFRKISEEEILRLIKKVGL